MHTKLIFIRWRDAFLGTKTIYVLPMLNVVYILIIKENLGICFLVRFGIPLWTTLTCWNSIPRLVDFQLLIFWHIMLLLTSSKTVMLKFKFKARSVHVMRLTSAAHNIFARALWTEGWPKSITIRTSSLSWRDHFKEEETSSRLMDCGSLEYAVFTYPTEEICGIQRYKLDGICPSSPNEGCG